MRWNCANRKGAAERRKNGDDVERCHQENRKVAAERWKSSDDVERCHQENFPVIASRSLAKQSLPGSKAARATQTTQKDHAGDCFSRLRLPRNDRKHEG